MSTFIKNERTGEMIEYPPYPCKLCGEYLIENQHDICDVCGWQDDGAHKWPDENCGANHLSFNDYKSVWENNKERIRNHGIVRGRLVREIFNGQK